MEGVTTEVIQEVANQTEGFSGREITKMVISWHDAAFTLPEPILTPELMFKVLKKFKLQHELKQTWSKEDVALMEKMDESELLKYMNQHKPQHTDEESTKERSPEALKQQQDMMDRINAERMEMKAMRDSQKL